MRLRGKNALHPSCLSDDAFGSIDGGEPEGAPPATAVGSSRAPADAAGEDAAGGDMGDGLAVPGDAVAGGAATLGGSGRAVAESCNSNSAAKLPWGERDQSTAAGRVRSSLTTMSPSRS